MHDLYKTYDYITAYHMGPEVITVILQSFDPCVVCFLQWGHLSSYDLELSWWWFFLTPVAKTSISEQGVDFSWVLAAIHFAEMTCPLYDHGTIVKMGDKFLYTECSLAFTLMANASQKQCCYINSFPLITVIVFCFGMWHPLFLIKNSFQDRELFKPHHRLD